MVSGVNFLTGILLARYLGLHEFGKFSLAWMVVLFVSQLQWALIISPMMSIGPKKMEAEIGVYYGSAIFQQLAFTLSSFVLLLVGVWGSDHYFEEWGVGPLAWPLALVVFAFQIQDFIRRYFFTHFKAKVAFTNDLISYGGQVALIVLMIMRDSATSANALWVIGATSLIAVLVGMLQMENIVFPPATYLWKTVKSHWAFSKWLAASAVLQWFTSNYLIIVASAILGSWVAGALRAAQNIMGVLNILFVGFNNAIPPKASKILAEQGPSALSRYLYRAGRVLTGVAIIFAVAVSVDPKFVLTFCYGDDYGAYEALLRGYAVIYILTSLYIMIHIGSRTLENTKYLFGANVISSLFIYFSATYLINAYGVVGVIVGMTASYLIIVSISFYGYMKGKAPEELEG